MKGLEHLKNGDYNPNTDYDAILKHYNNLVNDGKQDEAKAVLREFGGLISILYNNYKQKELNSKGNG